MARFALYLVGLFFLFHLGCTRPPQKEINIGEKIHGWAFEYSANKKKPSLESVQFQLEHSRSDTVTAYAEAEAFLNCSRRIPSFRTDALIFFSFSLTPEGDLSRVSRLRLDETLRLYREGKAKYILLTGGAGRQPVPLIESEIAKKYLVSKGVDSGHIFIETRSSNTLENIEFLLPIINQKKLKTLILVSSPYHLPRISRYFAKQMGDALKDFDVYWSSYPSSEDPIQLNHTDINDRDDQILKEVFAAIRDWVDYGMPIESCREALKIGNR